MSTFNDLLNAVDALNDPVTGATVEWQKDLQDPNNPQDVQDRAKVLESLDGAFHTARLQFNILKLNSALVQEEFVMLVEGYLQMTKGLYKFLLKSGNADPTHNQDVEDALNQVNGLAKKASDELHIPSKPDNLFLITMQPLIGKKEVIGGVKLPVVTQVNYDQTRKLFKRERFSLDDDAIQSLIDSWETVIAVFVRDNDPLSNPALASQVNVKGIALVKVDAEANLFTMHALLEDLYEQLETRLDRTTVDILSSAF
jgi:hypothetical protein